MTHRTLHPGKILRMTALVGVMLVALLMGVTTAGAQTQHATKPAGQNRPPGLAGTVRSVSGSTLTITAMPAGKNTVVHLTSTTTYLVNGKSITRRPAFKKGEMVMVTGSKAKDGSYTARSVMIGRPAGGPGGPPGPGNGPPPSAMARVDGTVVSVTTSSLTVKTSKGTRTAVRLTSATRFAVNGKSVSSRPRLESGETVHVLGGRSGTTITAQQVFVGSMPAAPAGGPPRG